jgi:hypothetical protein
MTNIDELCHPAQHLIRDISSAYMKANVAFRVGDDAEELKRLLSATRAISTLLLFKFDDRIDDCTAYEYATSLVSSAKRIENILNWWGVE